MTHPTIQISAIDSPRTSTSTTRRLKRDTGFPEAFNSCGSTSLPHPAADLSPNACISQDDFANLATDDCKRTRLSFLHRHRHRRNVSHATLSPQTAAMQSVLSVATIDTSTYQESHLSRQVSTDDTDSFASNNKKTASEERDEDTPPTSPEEGESRQQKSVFSKWRKN